ncbi:oxidoreductase [Flavobacterium piscis]|jgi:3-oxoacyl-[acyl-carrier protein] reductase|uniref:Oxidoreductase n=1 Tax=Flavobacterium piscis TaxID=1114874 RepID=A0ABX2XIL0_9FLAO|nr:MULTISPECIES: glucose 1-dehydrogenase [Flavobacterium]OCB73666.1 oxidoreductase [Flavobacterium piscis]OXE98487.1 oxidoreductase [Flavobacterium piscis]QDW21688.1 glucose 1-dehydrogenase [Flavobacterium sp. KBS0721]
MKLKGKTAVVTGGARDIGREVAIKLAKEGANVVVNYFLNQEDGDTTLKLIEEAGGKAIIVQGDMTKQEDIDNLVSESKKAFGEEVHVLVNVAGGLIARKTIEEMDVDFFDVMINVNFKSVFLVTKAFKPLMKSGASIINFASQAGRDGGGPGAALYASAKGAVMTYTRGLAKEFGPQGIRVNALCPGMIATAFHDTFTKPEVRTNVANGTPLRREGKASEVADLVAYLASDESSFLTGNNIDINGGLAFS